MISAPNINEKYREQFHRDGFVKVTGFLSPQEVDSLNEEIAAYHRERLPNVCE